MAARMQQRRGTAAQWTSANPILGSGEIGFETDTSKFKIGNGTSTWSNLTYFANINQILDGAPDLLNTLNEIAAAIGDDPNFITTIGDSVALKADTTYVDDEISDLNTAAQGYANAAEVSSNEYTDALIGDATIDGTGGNTVTARIASAVSGLVDSSPSTLNTLNELAAALNDDPSFATTVSTSIGTKLNLSGGTMTGFLTLSDWPETEYHAATKNYVDIAVETLGETLEEIDSGILIDISTINGSINTIEANIDTLQTTSATTATDLDTLEATVNTLSGSVDTLSSEVDTNSENITTLESDLGSLTTDVSEIATNVGTIETDLETLTSAVDLKSPIDGPAFTGTVSLPTTTSIGDVNSSEIGHLNGVTSSIQDQIDDKLDSSLASSTYAPLNDPTFGGTVSLPSTTSIGDVSSTELEYLDGVTSSIQTQLTDLDTTKADLESPTFTGTVSGVTKTHVGLGNADNTSDADKPISTTTQTALDAKLNLSGGTLTGFLTLSGPPTSDLHAATKHYVDGLAAGINFHQPVVAATVGNLAGTYDNGTSGLGATLTKASNGSIGTIDGATVSVGSRILLRAQTDPKENGVYTVTAVGSVSAPWQITRAADADNNPSGELATGDFCFVTSGSTNIAKGFVLNTTGTITIGTTEISYAQFNASEAVIAGTNINKTGETLSVVNAPTFSGVVTATSGVAFSDGTQTKAGVPSLTTFAEKTADYTLDTLAHQDNLVEMNSTSPMTFTIPTNATLAWPIGASMDILQTNTGEVTIAAVGGVTLNRTPGNKLRTQWSSATILKRGTDSWILYGDLKA